MVYARQRFWDTLYYKVLGGTLAVPVAEMVAKMLPHRHPHNKRHAYADE